MFKSPNTYKNPEIFSTTQPKFEDRTLNEGEGWRAQPEAENNASQVELALGLSTTIVTETREPIIGVPAPEIPTFILETKPENPSDLLKELLTRVRSVDWKKFSELIGGNVKRLMAALVTIEGNKDLANSTPKLQELLNRLNELLNQLTPEEKKKLSDAMNESSKNFIDEESKKDKSQDILENDSLFKNLLKEIEKVKDERLKPIIQNLLSSVNEISRQPLSSETKKQLGKLISLIGLILAMSGLLTTSGREKIQVGTNDVYEDIYGNQPKVTEELPTEEIGGTSTTKRQVEQKPDAGVNETPIDILQGVQIVSADEALQLFGERLGSKIDTRGKNVISIENKTGNKTVMQEMSESERKPDFILVAEVNGERVLINLQQHVEYVDGTPTINLDNLSDTELGLLRNGNPIIWGVNEVKNGVDTGPVVQMGTITGLSERASQIITNRIMNQIIEAQSRNRQ